MNFDPLVHLDKGGSKLYVCGAEHQTDSEGQGDFMVAQIYITDHDFPEHDTLVDTVGDRWKLTHAVERGFKMTGIVLERVQNV
jgi:hypothetical protein